MPATPANIAVSAVELFLLISGIVLWWRHVLRPTARAAHRHAPVALGEWNIPVSDFLLFVFLIIAGSLLASVVSNLITSPLHLPADTKKIIDSAAFQVGLLIGPALLPLKLGHHPVCPPLNGGTLRSGLITFLIALPIVTAVNLGWIGVLKVCGLPVEQQDLLRMFSEASSPALLGLMIVLATLIAPLTEELLFRAVLFRYLRTRLPRWLALLLPGVIFASLHVDWVKLDGLASFGPLVTLAIVFSLAYERTGRIGTVVVAHALFNLHTILVLFTGPTE